MSIEGGQMAFKELEKKRLTAWKLQSSQISDVARVNGTYDGRVYPFCLGNESRAENLYDAIRQRALAYFKDKDIPWHVDELRRKQQDERLPSTHLCDSQVCCVNFLFAFVNEPDALIHLLQPVYSDISCVVPMEESGELVTFEWIGRENYLNEKLLAGEQRTRGRNFTSADAAIMFERTNGQKQVVLIEWKYTESYNAKYLRFSKRGTDRRRIYAHILDDPACFLDRAVLRTDDDLFFDPFDQFFRQQALAWKMQHAKELGADVVSVLHISPRANSEFQFVTSAGLQESGEAATRVWKSLLRNPDSFVSVATEDLFGAFPSGRYPQLSRWWDYIHERYTWTNGVAE
jgi:hypothetical protein